MSQPTAQVLPDGDALAPERHRRRWMRLAIGLPILTLVWCFVLHSLIVSFRKIDFHQLHLDLWPIAAAVVALLAARLMNGMNCSMLLTALGQPAPMRHVVAAIWVASLGRYVPGKMAVVAGLAFLLVRLGVRLSAALAALSLSGILMILIGLITCTPLLFTPLMRQRVPFGWLISLLILLAGLVGLHPRVFSAICNTMLRRMKRQPLPHQLQRASLLRAVGFTVLRNLFLGLGLWLAMRSLSHVRLSDYALALGSAGLASVAGFLAVFAPAGLGVHEGVYILTLTPLLGPQAALLAVLFRCLHLLADAIAGAAGILMMKRPPAPDILPTSTNASEQP